MSRSTQIHRLVADTEKTVGVHIRAEYDDRDREWGLYWSNGPSAETLKAHLTRLARRAGLDMGLFALHRLVQSDALAVQAVRYLRTTFTGEDRYGYDGALAREIDRAAEQTDHPGRPADEREAVLATRLLAAEGGFTDPHSLTRRLLQQGGLAALLGEDLQTARPGDRLWASEYLTARYASGAHRLVWERHLQPMPAGEAFAAAVADAGASDVNEALTVRQAALTLAPLVRAEREAALTTLDATELGLITALREQKVA
jgi:hypothetical protein